MNRLDSFLHSKNNLSSLRPSSSEMHARLNARSVSGSSSYCEPRPICGSRSVSFFNCLPQPFSIFEAIETAARLICIINSYDSSFEKFAVNLQISPARICASSKHQVPRMMNSLTCSFSGNRQPDYGTSTAFRISLMTFSVVTFSASAS